MTHHLCQLPVVEGVQPIDVVDHAIAEQFALHLVSGDARIGVVKLDTRVLAREALRRHRVQRCGIDGYRALAADGNSGRRYPAAEGVAGVVDIDAKLLKIKGHSHCAVVVIGLQADRLRAIDASEVFDEGLARLPIRKFDRAGGALERDGRLVAGAKNLRIGQIYLGTEAGALRF